MIFIYYIYIWYSYIIFILLSLLLKSAAKAREGKNRVVSKFLSQPHKHPTENWWKHNSGKQLTVDCTVEPIQRSGANHSVGKVIHIRTWAGRKYLPNWIVLHLDTSNSNGWAPVAVRVGNVELLVEEDGSSLNRQWLEFALTLCNINSPAARRRLHNDKKLWSGQSLATEYTWRWKSWRWYSAANPHTGEQYSRIWRTNEKKQWSNTDVSTNIRTSHQPQNTVSLRDTGDNTTHMVVECELAVKLDAKDVEVGTSSDRNPRQYQVTIGRVLSPGSAND